MTEASGISYRYKYLPFSDGALEIIKSGTIKFTSPLEFNDPFDSRPYITPESIELIFSERPDLFKRAGKELGLSPAKRLQSKGKLLTTLRKNVLSGNFQHNLLKDTGIVCLSRAALNILMWSHYADSHRGFVVEFAIPKFGTRQDAKQAVDLLVSFPVVYRTKRPHVSLGSNGDFRNIEESILTKSVDWEYEAEERVIGYYRKPGIYKYQSERVLSSIVAGTLMGEDNYKRLNEILIERNRQYGASVNLYRATLNSDSYGITVPNHPRLGA